MAITSESPPNSLLIFSQTFPSPGRTVTGLKAFTAGLGSISKFTFGERLSAVNLPGARTALATSMLKGSIVASVGKSPTITIGTS